MRRATRACASLLLLAGLTAGCGDDSDKDSTSEETSSSPTASDSPPEESTEETEESTDDESSEESGETPSEGASVDPANADYCAAAEAATAATEFGPLQEAVGDLLENLPDDAGSDVEAGLTFLKDALESSSSEKEFVKKAGSATPEESAAVQAYSEYEAKTCAMPSVPSSTPSD